MMGSNWHILLKGVDAKFIRPGNELYLFCINKKSISSSFYDVTSITFKYNKPCKSATKIYEMIKMIIPICCNPQELSISAYNLIFQHLIKIYTYY